MNRTPYVAWVALLALLAAAPLPGCRSDTRTGEPGPLKILFTGDVGGYLDPCG